MDNCDIQLIGSPCGQHGPYTFYKAFKYTTKNGRKRIVTLSEFFFIKLWIDSDLLCIGELQLLWCDKNSEQVLASLRLYFLPENTPEGRLDHGEDEVLAISEKVVLRVEDLINWITVDAEWTWGRLAKCEKDVKEAPDHCTDDNNKSTIISTLTDSSLDFSDVEKERKTLDCNNAENEGPLVIILSYPRYCRYRAMMRRLEGVEDDYLKYKIVRALGGFTVLTKNTRVLFCKDTFDYPELEGHELLCNHLAPKLKGRPRGKRKKLRSMSPGSESNESEESTSIINIFPTISEKITTEGRNGLRCNSSSSSSVNNNDNTTSLRRSNRTIENSESKQFLKELTIFMKKNYTPIGKVPSLGYKEIDLYGFYIKVQKLGGYDSVTTNRLWKSIFDDMSGHQNSTSAATVIRRHYERFLLPYERYVKNEEHKPLPVSERRRLKSKNGNSSTSDDAETSEGTSRSGNSTPVPQTPNTPVENKEFNIQVKTESKTSSLRSIRVKSERQKEKQTEKTNSDKIDNNNDNVDDKKLESILIKPEKDVEPLTTAVAPVVQKLPPEKTPEPVEAKENVPTGGDVPNRKSPDIIEVPYNNNNNNNSNNNDNKQQTKSPEIIDLDDKTTILLNDMKKDKLDILKEGGLEVTPIRTFIPPSPPVKDIRPSVIQPTGVVVHQMPPPPPPPLLPQPPPPPLPPTTQQLPQALSVNQLTTNYRPQQKQQQQQKTKPNGFVTSTTTTPPKVLQSKSIFSSSTTTERTVYGDPREFNLTTINLSKFKSVPQQQQQPQPQQPVASQLPCDILDLSVTNLKKSAVEIMKLQPYQHYKNLQQQHQQQQQQQQQQQKQYNKPLYNHLLDGRRLGSNVEITLVNNNNNNNHNNNHNKSSIPNQSKFHNVASTPINHTNRPVHKRPSNEIYPHPKLPKLDDVKLNKSNNIIQPHSSRDHKYHDILYPNNNLMKVPLPPPPLPQQQQQQHHHHHHQQHHHPHQLPHNTKLPSSIPSYLAQLYDKSLPPTTPYLPFLDPFYYLYSHGNTTAVTTTTTSTTTTHHPPAPAPPPPPPPILPFPSQEQLKFYSDLMVRNSRLNFPFHINPNEHLSHFKKS